MEYLTPQRVNAVLQTWYGDINRDKPTPWDEMKKWYTTSEDFDKEILDKHSEDLGTSTSFHHFYFIVKFPNYANIVSFVKEILISIV